MPTSAEYKTRYEFFVSLFERTRAKGERLIKAAESGFGGIDADLWRTHLAENERLRQHYIPEYRPRSG